MLRLSMFTGIIETTGTLTAITPTGGDVRLTIAASDLDFGDVKLGDSIASNGICLTVVAIDGNSYAVDVSRETLAISALNVWKVGDTLNLEKAMLPTTFWWAYRGRSCGRRGQNRQNRQRRSLGLYRSRPTARADEIHCRQRLNHGGRYQSHDQPHKAV